MKRIIQGLVLATLISTAQASPFPGNGDPVSLPAESTYADRFAGEVHVGLDSAIAGNGDPVSLPALSTYADQFATDRARQAAASIE